MEKYDLYEPGYVLKDDEYLLRINDRGAVKVGFITKLNQNGTVPFSFINWPRYGGGKGTPIYVVKETFRSGWKLSSWRFGESQNWASLIHPDGYTLEVYLHQFLQVILENVIENGEIIGEFKWDSKKLIKQIPQPKLEIGTKVVYAGLTLFIEDNSKYPDSYKLKSEYSESNGCLHYSNVDPNDVNIKRN